MNTHNAELKVYEEKVAAELRGVKAKIDEFEAHIRGKGAEAEVRAINTLKTKHQEIEKKRQELKTAGEAKAAQIKAEVDAELGRLKTSSEQLSAKIKSHAATT
jgi:hypothetical protein